MKIRINDLARELEVKSKAVLDALQEIGVTEKKTHSSSVEEDEADRVRKYFAAKSGASREKSTAGDIKPNLDLSKVSKPGDVLKLLKQQRARQAHSAAPARPAAPAAPPAAKAPVAPAPHKQQQKQQPAA